jgi:CubicO group peptidase (beta-lactamase class C family)
MKGIVVILVMMAVTGAAWAASVPEAKEIDSIFSFISSSEPGAAVLVVQNGKAVFRKGYGVTDLRTRHHIDEHTNFRLASLSKQFTATAIMLLAHDRKLHYSDRLTDIFHGFPQYGKQITVRQLLTHTSGLLEYEDLMEKQDPTAPGPIRQIRDAEVYGLLATQKTTKFEPGSRWEYSNSGYCMLAMIVEKVAAQPFQQFLEERIFHPLHMDKTVAFVAGKNDVEHRAFGHTKKDGAWQETDQSPTSATLGDGGIYTSIDDLAKWDRALSEHALLEKDELNEAFVPTPAKDAAGKIVSYGFGWFLDPYKGHERMWHYGETVGFRTSIQRFPKEKLTVVVLSNRAEADAPGLGLKVAELFLGK